MRTKGQFLSSRQIRQQFLDFFQGNSHTFMKSSPVRPPSNDPTLEFVNAGMNQFKSIFLGLERSKVKRAVNTQKCIRVGGKHNDLSEVGYDSYHHTFFEMLGSWSFSDYFKEEGCKLAWELLTSPPFSLDPQRLYVSYFAGDQSLGLQPDLETRDIWLKIGVKKDRVLGFGAKDNFWEMGPEGPCGPSTEIHYDHLGNTPRPSLVNSGLPDLTEIWNLVFIQYNRLAGRDNLEKLDSYFVDTGLGLERLTALLQGKTSNYDTDLFMPYFSLISKICNCDEYKGRFGDDKGGRRDTGYRILADHVRMMSIAIADNMFPDESHGLRRVMRKAFSACEMFMNDKEEVSRLHLLLELCRLSSQLMSPVFPELALHLKQIEWTVTEEYEKWEESVKKTEVDWKELRKELRGRLDELEDERSPGLIAGVREVYSWSGLGPAGGKHLPRDLALTLNDRHGLHPQLILRLAQLFGCQVDEKGLEEDMERLREKNKAALYRGEPWRRSLPEVPEALLKEAVRRVRPTDRGPAGDRQTCRVTGLAADGRLAEPSDWPHLLSTPGLQLSLLLDSSPFWPVNSLQASLLTHSDIGTITLRLPGAHSSFASLNIGKVLSLNGYLFHFPSSVSVNEMPLENYKGELVGEARVEGNRRAALSRSTTASHLTAHALRQLAAEGGALALVTHLSISPDSFTLGLTLCPSSISLLRQPTDVKQVEECVLELIKSKFQVQETWLSVQDIDETSGLTLSPFLSPNVKDLRIASFLSSEVVNNTNASLMWKEVTVGPNLTNTGELGEICFTSIERRKKDIILTALVGPLASQALEQSASLMSHLQSQDKDIEELKSYLHIPLSWDVKILLNQKLSSKKNISVEKRDSLKHQIKEVQENGSNYLVSFAGENVKLEKCLDDEADIPVFLFGITQKKLIARCFVPEKYDGRSAKEWAREVAKAVGGEAVPSRSGDPRLYTLRPLKVSPASHLTAKAQQAADRAAQKLFPLGEKS